LPDSSRYDDLQEAEKEDESFASKAGKGEEYNTKRQHQATVAARGSKRTSDNISFFYQAAHRSRLMSMENEGKMHCDAGILDLNTSPAQKEVISGAGKQVSKTNKRSL
jgi:hypothetical protein